MILGRCVLLHGDLVLVEGFDTRNTQKVQSLFDLLCKGLGASDAELDVDHCLDFASGVLNELCNIGLHSRRIIRLVHTLGVLVEHLHYLFDSCRVAFPSQLETQCEPTLSPLILPARCQNP